MNTYGYGLADSDFYVPSHGGWTGWSAKDVVRVDEGWKVHVSAQIDRVQNLLNIVAEACFSEHVSFHQIRTELCCVAFHHKQGPREHAGNFCAPYPADEAAARRSMDGLASALSAEPGTFVLTNRRYGDSCTVHYRGGALTGQAPRRADGRRAALVRRGLGRDVVDVWGPAFVLTRWRRWSVRGRSERDPP